MPPRLVRSGRTGGSSFLLNLWWSQIFFVPLHHQHLRRLLVDLPRMVGTRFRVLFLSCLADAPAISAEWCNRRQCFFLTLCFLDRTFANLRGVLLDGRHPSNNRLSYPFRTDNLAYFGQIILPKDIFRKIWQCRNYCLLLQTKLNR